MGLGSSIPTGGGRSWEEEEAQEGAAGGLGRGVSCPVGAPGRRQGAGRGQERGGAGWQTQPSFSPAPPILSHPSVS